jgi:radial spoke head protein 4A
MAAVHADPEQELLFEQAKAFLMQADADGQSVYDNLHSIVSAMLEENPGDVAHHPERFADLSSKLKKHVFVGAAAPTSAANAAPPTHYTQVERSEANRRLFEKPAPEVKTVVEQPTPFTTVTTTTIVPKQAPRFKSVVLENAFWKHAGVGLSDNEAFLLDQSITRLAAEKDLSEVRFVGKILGTSKNYLVVSSKRWTAPEEKVYEEVNTMPKPPRKKVEVDIQSEPAYKGCNRLSFWVTHTPSTAWVLLPDVTPQQLNAARKIRKFFSGNLDAKINAYPAFPWTEAVYLRAQLSRIVSATYIAPNGFLEKVEPEEEEEADDEEEGKKKGPKPAKYWPLTKANKEPEEIPVPGFADPETWVHSEGYIYETGRQTKVPPKPETEEEEEAPPEDEEEEEEKKEEEEKELFNPIKKDASYAIIHLPKEPNPEEEDEAAEEEPPAEEGEGEEKEEKEEDEEEIADDDPLRKKIPAWVVRLTNTLYKSHSVAVVRSLRWPGAVAYAAQKGKQWGAVYFGYGFKKTDHAFAPVPSIDILKEAEDITEAVDPTAANEKLVMRGEEPKEADSEDEKDEEEDAEEA